MWFVHRPLGTSYFSFLKLSNGERHGRERGSGSDTARRDDRDWKGPMTGGEVDDALVGD